MLSVESFSGASWPEKSMGGSVLGIKIYDNFNKILDSGSSLQLNLVRCPQVVPLCTITWSHQAHPALTKLVSWPWTASMLIHMCEQETLVFSDYYICLFLFAPTLPLFFALAWFSVLHLFSCFCFTQLYHYFSICWFLCIPCLSAVLFEHFLVFFSVLYLLFFAELYHYLLVSLYSLSESFLSIWLCFFVLHLLVFRQASNSSNYPCQMSVHKSVTLLNFHSISVSGQSQNVRRDLWPLRHLIRVMRQNEPGVYGGLNVSRVGLYGGSNARKCMMAAMLFKNIYRRSKMDANRNLGLLKGIIVSGSVWRPKCFSGVWRHQCSKMYDGSNALQKYIQCIFPKCTRLACLLNFASLLTMY